MARRPSERSRRWRCLVSKTLKRACAVLVTTTVGAGLAVAYSSVGRSLRADAVKLPGAQHLEASAPARRANADSPATPSCGQPAVGHVACFALARKAATAPKPTGPG